MTKDERNKRLKERRMALVLTWTICWMAGLMTGLFVEKMAQQLRKGKEKTVEIVVERAESDAEARERGEIKLHTRAWRVGLKRAWSAQTEAEVVVHAASETEAPETPVPTPEPKAVPTPEPTPEPKWIKVLATAYRDSKNAVPTGCINDLPLTEYWSIAAVLGDLPYGTLVEIDGYGVRRVEDTASRRVIDIRLRQAWDRGCATWIDIYMPDAAEVDAFGVRELRLRVIE